MYNNSWALLPAGRINFATGDTTYFNVVENCYGHEGTLVLVQRNEKYHVLSSAGSHESWPKQYPIGSRVASHHDQTRRRNETSVIVGYYPCTNSGLKEIAEKTGKKSTPFAVFK